MNPSSLYEIRGQKVILDRDLAAPEDFMFQLTKEEWQNISSQIVTTSPQRRRLTALPDTIRRLASAESEDAIIRRFPT